MKFNLLTKYIFIYVSVAIIGFVGVTVISYKIDYNRVYSEQTENMYRQAVSIAAEFAPDYFSNDKLKLIQLELHTITELDHSRIMFVDMDGNVILDTQYNNMNEEVDENGILYTINNFDVSKLGTNHSMNGNFYGVFTEKNVSVFAPITNKFVMKGYVVVHMPESVITDRVYTTFNTNYITLLIILVLNSAFIILYIIHIHNPLKDITNAIKEYGRGNLSYKVAVGHNDEIGQLSASLNYMATQINEMDQFQQKFLSNISHDFRSPLTSIKGYLEAIADGTIPPEMINKYINIVLFETDRLTKLTSNILTLNELDPKSVRLDISSFDINALIKHTIETFEGTCKKKKIQFQLTFSAEKELVSADKVKIGQVIYNLVDNSIKFSSENSNIFISVKEKGEKAYISVKDSGAGISKENIDRIWDRFYKSDSSRGRDKKGSGLGLSIVKETLLAHNENIDVISTIGVGTEFIFSLPIAKSAENT